MIYPEPDSTERRKRYQDTGDIIVKEKQDIRVILCVILIWLVLIVGIVLLFMWSNGDL